MDIDNILKNIEESMQRNKGEHFTVEYQKTQFGVIQGGIIAVVFGLLTINALFWTLEYQTWYFAALAGYFSWQFKSGIELCLAAAATFLGFKKTKLKEEIIGR